MAGVQEKHAQNSGISTIGVTFDSNVTAGNLLVCAVHVANAGAGVAVSSMSDDVNGGWTATPSSPITGGPQDGKLWIYYRANAGAGATTVTVVTDASGAIKLQCWERSGLATASPLDDDTTGSGSGTTIDAGTLSLTTTVDVIAACETSGGAPTQGSGFTLDDATGNYWYDGDQSKAGTSATNTEFTAASGSWIAIAAAFKEAGGASEDVVAAGSLSITGAAVLKATGTLLAAGALSITGVADLDARGSLLAAGSVSITGAADLDARGVLLAAGSLSISGVADLDAIGSLLAAGTLSINGAADLAAPNASDMSAAGSLSIIGAAALNAIGQLVAAGSIVIDSTALLTSNVIAVADSPSGGWYYDFEANRERRRKRQQELEDAEDEAEKLENKIDREIAQLLHEQERKDEKRKDLERIKALVKRYESVTPVEVSSERVLRALSEAKKKASTANLERLQREFERMVQEENDFLALVMILANE